MTKGLCICIPISDLKPSSPQIIEDLFQSIVNNGIDEFCEVVCLWDSCKERLVYDFEQKYPQFISMPQYKNRLNFSKNSNRGMRFAHNELKLSVLLVNQDCILPKWEILERLMVAPEVGIVTPTAIAEFPKEIGYGGDPSLVDWPIKDDFTETRGKFSFHCPYIPFEVTEEIGYNDEGIISHGDDDMIIRSLLAGFTNYISKVQVVHKGSYIDQSVEGSSMSGSYDGERLGIDHQRFRWKWSIPNEVQHDDFSEWILSKFRWEKELMYVY